MTGRTVILVSHAVGLVLPRADYVVVVKNGTISAQGTPQSLIQGTSLTGIVSDEVLARGPDAFMEDLEGSRSELNRDSETTLGNSKSEEKRKDNIESSTSEEKRKDTGKLVKDETMSNGAVRLSVYWAYFKAAGGISFLTLFFLSYVLMFGADVANSWWLMVWSGASEAPPCPGSNVTTGNGALFYSDSYHEGQLNQSPFIATIMSMPSIVPVTVMGGESDPVDTMYYIKFYALFGI
jgi:hypothetical protein